MKGLCSFCPQRSSYVCPTCGRSYCSLDCFKCPRHNECAQRFYRRSVLEEFQADGNLSTEMNQRLKSMLAEEFDRTKDTGGSEQDEEEEVEEGNDDEIDSDDDVSLNERLKNVRLDDTERVWSLLTEEEREDFRQQMECGTIAVDEWKPWWEKPLNRKLITTIGPNSNDSIGDGSVNNRMPPLLTHIPALSKLTRNRASPLVFNKLFAVLYSYSYLSLVFEDRWRCSEVVPALCRLCPCLVACSGGSCDSSAPPTTVAEAVRLVDAVVENSDWKLMNREQVSAARFGVLAMLNSGRSRKQRVSGIVSLDATYALAALSDLWRLVNECCQTLRQRANTTPTLALSFASNGTVSLNRRQLKVALKQIEYLFAWTRDSRSVLKDKLSTLENKRVVLPTDRL